MDDLEVANFWRKNPGSLSPWCRLLIGGTTLATIVVAYLAWHLIWRLYGFEEHFYAFWVRNGVWLGVAATSLAAFVPPSRVSRFIRLATLLPLIHLVAVIASAVLWLYIAAVAEHYGSLGELIAMPMGAWARIGIAAAVLVTAAWLIDRREWLQSMLVLALSFMLLFGLWLSYCSASWFRIPDRDLYTTLLDPDTFLEKALVAPTLAALAFTVLVMRWPRFATRKRVLIASVVGFALAVGVLGQLAPVPDSVVLYLNTVHLVLIAQGLAITTLVIVGIATWLRSRRGRLKLRAAHGERATIVDPDGHGQAVVELQLASWLRAPRISTYPFEIHTSRGPMPVAGAPVLWSVPAASTRLAIGESCPVLRRGDAITIYRHATPEDDHPFRSTHHGDVLAVAEPGATAGLGNTMLMLWRPATAYMAIALAVMIPVVLALRAT